MRVLEKNNTVFHLYDSIEEMPAVLHNEFNIALLESEGIGFGIESLKTHNQKILDFLNFKNYAFALEQAKNQHFCLVNIEKNYNPKRAAFCHLICSIDGKQPVTRNVEYLSGLIQLIDDETIERLVEEIKKKLMPN